MQVLYRAFRHALEWVTGESKKHTPPEKLAATYCHPHLNALVDEFLYRWGKGQIPISQSTRYQIKANTWWEVKCVGQPAGVSIWTHNIQMEIRIKDVATIKIPDWTRRINKHTDGLDIEWEAIPMSDPTPRFIELTTVITNLLDKHIVMEPIMNQEPAATEITFLSELVSVVNQFNNRVNEQHPRLKEGHQLPDERAGQTLCYRGYNPLVQEHHWTFTRAVDQASFELVYKPIAEQTEYPRVKFKNTEFKPNEILGRIKEAFNSRPADLSQQTVEQTIDKLKNSIDEFLDRAPLVSTSNFGGEPKEFVLGITFIVSIQRYEAFRPGNLRIHIYDIDRTLLAKINYTKRDNICQVERPRERIMLNDLVEVFDFARYPVGINNRSSDYLHNTPPVRQDKQVYEKHLVQTDEATRELISEHFRLITNTEFFKNVRKGVVPKDIRNALGYSLRLNRFNGYDDYAPVKVEVFAVHPLDCNGEFFFTATYALDGGFYFDPGSVSGVNLAKYFELVEAIVEQEKKAWETANWMFEHHEGQPDQHQAVEPKLLNEAGDDISDEWVAWHVRWHHSSLGMAVKAGLRKVEQSRKQLENVLNKYGN